MKREGSGNEGGKVRVLDGGGKGGKWEDLGKRGK